jgi:hypothetical protein
MAQPAPFQALQLPVLVVVGAGLSLARAAQEVLAAAERGRQTTVATLPEL